ncbi:MAG: DUF3343 domain-containing protein [Deltaproteobacteria bacterium]|nr:MAG: DUF3343 domain-containing protein [Deltaproteobacteria bacterium]
MVNDQDYVAIFHSIHRVLRAEQLLKQRQVAFLLIPVPRKLTSDCGLALRIAPANLAAVFAELAGAGLLPPELYQLRGGEYVALDPEALAPSAGTT